MRSVGVEVVGFRDLAELAQVHDGQHVSDVLGNGEVMGDEDQGQSVLGLEVAKQVEDLCLDTDVERTDRFIADENLGAEDQAPSDGNPLSLTT